MAGFLLFASIICICFGLGYVGDGLTFSPVLVLSASFHSLFTPNTSESRQQSNVPLGLTAYRLVPGRTGHEVDDWMMFRSAVVATQAGESII
jgi:hypothetical protein